MKRCGRYRSSRKTKFAVRRRGHALLACAVAGMVLAGTFFAVSIAPPVFAAEESADAGTESGRDLPEETSIPDGVEAAPEEASETPRPEVQDAEGMEAAFSEEPAQEPHPSSDAQPVEPSAGHGDASTEGGATPAPSAGAEIKPPASTTEPQLSSASAAAQALGAEIAVPSAVRDLASAVTIDPSATVLSKNGTPLQTGSLVSGSDSLTLRYQFSFDEAQGASVVLDDPQGYTVPLPAGLRWRTADGGLFGPVAVNATVGGVSYQYASLYIDPTVNRAYLIFTGSFWAEGFREMTDGWIELECRLDMDAIGTDETVTVGLFDGSALMNLRVEENQPTSHALAKSGVYAGNVFTWDITYTPGNVDGTTIPGLVKDSFDTSLMTYVPGSFLAGTDAGALSPVPDSALAVSADGGATTLAYDLHQSIVLTAGTPVYIRYQTVLSDAQLGPETGGTSFKDTQAVNTVRLYDADGNDKKVSAAGSVKVAAAEKKWLSKEATGMSADGRHIDWKVTVRTLDRKLDHLMLYERLDDNHTLDAASVVVSGTTGSLFATPGTAPTGGAYTFRIALDQLADGSYPDEIVITYTTDVKPGHFDDQAANLVCNNWAWLDFDWYDYGDGTTAVPFTFPELNLGKGVHTGLLSKTAEGYDRGSHTITWKVVVNPHAAWVKSGVVTDDLAGLGLTYVDGSFTPSDAALLALDHAASTPKKLVVDLVGEDTLGQGAVSFTFRTTVDDKSDYAYNTPNGKNYKNTAVFDGEVRGNRELSGTPQDADSSSSAVVKVASEVLKKNGKYDYRNNTVTWTVTLNQNNMPMNDVVLADTIPAYQNYVDGSARLDGGTAGFTANAVDGVLEISLGRVDTQQEITYQTVVDPDKLDSFRTSDRVTLHNDIVLRRGDGFNDLPYSAEVTVQNQLMKKSAPAQGSNDFIEYTVDLNPHGITLDDIVFQDTLPDGLALDPGSVRLYTADVNQNGVFSATSAYLDADDLKLTLDPAQNSFSFRLPDGNGTYRLVYGCDIVDRSKAPFQNEAVLSGGNVSGAPAQSGVNTGAGGGGGGMGLDTRRAALSITKTESVRPGIDMSGIRFGLFQTIAGQEQCILEETTDADGKLTFYPLILNQAYTIRELDGPDGYTPFVATASGTIALTDYTITPTKPRSVETIHLSVINIPNMSNIDFTNVNDWGRPLPGCNFGLEDLTPGSTLKQTYTSGRDGTVHFGNVPPGRYRLVQKTTEIPGHIANTSPYLVEVAADGTYRIYLEAGGESFSGTLVNEVIKVDAALKVFAVDGNRPLEGVWFQALDSTGKMVAQGYSEKDGTVLFRKLAVGETYTIVEAENNGYTLSPNRTFSIPIDAEGKAGEPVMTIDWPKTREQLIETQPPEPLPETPQPHPETSANPDTSVGNGAEDTTDAAGSGVQEVRGGGVPKTGDEANLVFWIVLGMLSVGAVSAVFVLKRRYWNE